MSRPDTMHQMINQGEEEKVPAILISTSHDKKKGFLKVSWIAIIALPAIYWYLLLKNSANLPFWDDYDIVLRFLNHFVQANSFHEKLILLFSQHNEHRLFFNYIAALADYKVFGNVNFVRLIIFGNIGWALIVYILYREFRSTGLNMAYFLPVMLIMFNLTLWDQMSWATSSISLDYGIFFVLASLYILTKRPGFTGLACCLFLMAMSFFTNGCGFALMPVVFLVLISRKRYVEFAGALLVSVLLVLTFFYLLQYEMPAHHVRMNFAGFAGLVLYSLANLGNTYMASNMQFKYAHILKYGRIPSSGDFTPLVYVSAACGLAFIIFFLYLWAKGLYKRNDGFVFWAVIWIVIASLELAIGRNDLAGPHTSLLSRYSVFPHLLTSCLYIAGLNYFKETGKILKKFAMAWAACALLLYAATYSQSTWLLGDHRYAILRYHKYGIELGMHAYSPDEITLLFESGARGIYHVFPNLPANLPERRE